MKKRILSALLATSMVATSAPTAFAVDVDTSISENDSVQSGGEVAQNDAAVVEVGDAASLELAIENGTSQIALTASIVLDKTLVIDKPVTIDGRDNTITGTVHLKNGTVQNMIFTNEEKKEILTIGNTETTTINLLGCTVLYPSDAITSSNQRDTISHTLEGNAATINIKNSKFLNNGRSETEWSYGLYINGQANEGSIQFVNNEFNGAFRTMLPNISGNVIIQDNEFVNSVYSVANGPTSGSGGEATCITTAKPSENDNLVITGNTFNNAGAFYFQQTEKAEVRNNEFNFDTFEHYIQAAGGAAHPLDLTENRFKMGYNDLVIVDTTAAPVKLPTGQRAVSYYPWAETPEGIRPADYSSYKYSYNADGSVTFYPASESAFKAFLSPATGNLGVDDGDTVSLECALTDIGNLSVSSDITFDGNGKTISGDSAIHIGTNNHVTFSNIVFKDIQKAGGQLSSIYANGFAGSLTIKGCEFDNIQYEALQVTPVAGASIAVTDNTFRKSDEKYKTTRYIHIESAPQVDFAATITKNKFYDMLPGVNGNAQNCGAVEVYYFTNREKVQLSGNFIEDIEDSCILMNNGINAIELLFPLVSEDLTTPIKTEAVVKNGYSFTTYTTLTEAVEHNRENTKITLLSDVDLQNDLDLGVHTIDANEKKIVLGVGVTLVSKTDISDMVAAQSNYRVVKSGDETNGFTYTVKASSSGGGSSSGGSSGGKTETTTNPDGSTTTTVTKPDGSKTETTKHPDGSKEVVETKKDGTTTTTTTDKEGNKTETVEKTDGSSTTKVENKDGSSSTTTVSKDGETETTVKLPRSVIDGAKGEAVQLPMPEAEATKDADKAPTVTVDLPSSEKTKVEVPVKDVTAGTVAVLVKADGTEEVIKTTVESENGIIVALADGDTIKIVDNSKDFTDVPDSFWGAEAIDFATSRELFSGTSETTFSPNDAMTRAMIVTVLARLDGEDTTGGETWYEIGRKWAMENGISDGTGMMNRLTREQLIAMLWRYAGNPTGEKSLADFKDAGSVSDYAQEAFSWAVEQGIITGMSADTLNPKGEATRAQVSSILMRFCENIAK